MNLQRGQFWIFNRVGFYGKGLLCTVVHCLGLQGLRMCTAVGNGNSLG